MFKNHRWISMLLIVMGTGFLLVFGKKEQEKESRRNETAEKFTETAILFRQADYEWILNCYPEELGEIFLFDLKETGRCVDSETRKILSEAELEVMENRTLDDMEIKKLGEIPEEVGEFSEAYIVKIRMSIPKMKEKKILEYLVAEYDGHYGVWGIYIDGLNFYLWETHEKILMKKIFCNGNGDISREEEYEYDENMEEEIDYGDGTYAEMQRNYEYDDMGNVVKEIYRDKKGGYVISEYNRRGVLTGKYIVHLDGSITECEYDPQGNIYRRCEYNREGIVRECDEYRRMMRMWYEMTLGWEISSDTSEKETKEVIMDYQYAEIPDNIVWEENMGIEISYYGDGTICGLRRYEYNESGRLTGRNQYFRDGTKLARYEWEYDDQGKLMRELFYDRDGEVECNNEWEYDDAGNIVRERYYGSREEYEYDETGQLIHKTFYGSKGKFSEHEYKYDESGKLVEDMLYAQVYFEGYMKKYEYDTAGNMIQEIHYLDKKESERRKYEYNTQGNCIGMAIYDIWGGEEKLQCSYEYEYDSKGNKVGETVYHADGSIYIHTKYIGIRAE